MLLSLDLMTLQSANWPEVRKIWNSEMLNSPLLRHHFCLYPCLDIFCKLLSRHHFILIMTLIYKPLPRHHFILIMALYRSIICKHLLRHHFYFNYGPYRSTFCKPLPRHHFYLSYGPYHNIIFILIMAYVLA